jgi:hypothetical protein
MVGTKTIIEQAYSAFNKRGALVRKADYLLAVLP